MVFSRLQSRQLRKKMDAAQNYAEWAQQAVAYDQQSGMSDWKSSDASKSYDYRSIRQRLDLIRDLRFRQDYHQLLFTLNEGIHGNVGGMGKPALYNKAKFGTKNLIHQFVSEVCGALKDIDEVDESIIAQHDKEDFFIRAGHCYGRSALMLSGGAVLGFFHAGVVKALFEQDLLPDIISGSSAGSIIAATACTHTDEELSQRLSIDNLHHEVDQTSSIRPTLSPFASRNQPMDANNLRDYLSKIIPDLTFQEAFALTGRKLNITVTGLAPEQAPRLLNAITSPNVLIRSAVMASCAIYGIYPSVTLQCRNAKGETVPYLPDLRWIDGSFVDDLPARRLTRLYGVNHFIASMTNPAALAITPDPNAPGNLLRTALNYQRRMVKNATTEMLKISRDHLRFKSPALNMIQHLSYGVLAQDYTADINIFLRNRWDHPLRLLAPPSRQAMLRLIREGERATWERIEMVRNCTAVSRSLDDILQRRGLEQ